MHNRLLTEALVHDRQRELRRSASQRGDGSHRRSILPVPVRALAGWLLVRNGPPQARAEPPRPEGPGATARPVPMAGSVRRHVTI